VRHAREKCVWIDMLFGHHRRLRGCSIERLMGSSKQLYRWQVLVLDCCKKKAVNP
jgi:hypothetical protein